MLRYSSAEAADTYVSTRLGTGHGYMFGTLPASVKVKPILERYLETV